MTKPRVVWFAVTAVAAAGLAVGAWLSRHEEVSGDELPRAVAAAPPAATRSWAPAVGQQQDAQQLALLREELTSLRVELATVRDQVDKARARAEPTSRGEVEDESARMAQRAEGDAMHQARLASVESAFRGEPVDSRWAADANSNIRDALASTRIDASKLRAMECRSRTCRVELTEDDPGALSKALPIFALQVGGALPSLTADHVDDGQGRRTAILYLSANP